MEEHVRRNSDSNDNHSTPSSHIGRVMNALLTARPRKLEDAISRIGSDSQRCIASLEEPLCFLRNYVTDTVEKGENLDQILVPMIENSLKSKDSRHCNQVLILLNWLFKDKLLFQALATNLAEIIIRKDDRYVTLGWCTLICGLVDYESTMSLYSKTGIQEKHRTLLRILFRSTSHLLSVVCNGSIVQGEFELPTRLAVAAADCILIITEASTKKPSTSVVANINTESQLVSSPSTASVKKKIKSSSGFQQDSETMEVEVLLWDHKDELIILVQRLLAWSKKSRPLHAKGLEQVLKWLLDIKGHWESVIVKAGGNTPNAGVALLSSCWKHYSALLRLEYHKFSQHYLEMLNQYISGIQIYMKDYSSNGNKDGGETRKFFLISIALLLGRLDNKQFGISMSEHGLEISRLLLAQLQYVDEDAIEVAVCILRATIFKTNCSSIDKALIDSEQMEIVFPSLLSLLDERDTTARAVVMLTAEYCSINPNGYCLQEVFKRLGAENLVQRRNAIDIISELLHISSDSRNLVSHSMRQDISQNLLNRLTDDEPVMRVQASNLLASLDPSVVLPDLVRLVYSPYEIVTASASNTILEVLKCHSENPDVIVMLINCVSQLCQSPEDPNSTSEKLIGPKFDSNQVLKLIPEWSKSVQDWKIYVEPLLSKMLSEPSNVVIIRFLSYISENLAEVQDMVLHRVLLHMQGQKVIDEKLMYIGESGAHKCDQSVIEDNLFDRLCPLLIIRLLPLSIFNDLNSTHMYGQQLVQDALHGAAPRSGDFSDDAYSSIASILITRALHKSEVEDVRKVAAELCGRIHPQVLFPIIQPELAHAAYSRDILKMKACLFAICTSLVIRGCDSVQYPAMLEIRTILEIVLLWPSLDSNEVSKAQHGCIDCLALMICAEEQQPDSFKDSAKISMSGKKSCIGDTSSASSTLDYVIHNLTHISEVSKISQEPTTDAACETKEAYLPISFHLCMANVLISACQKISSSGKNSLAEKILPVLIRSVEAMMDSEVRAACIQVLFSAVYHLKSAILPYSCDLLKLSIKALRKGSHKEKLASVKLLASLLGSEDRVVGSISSGLLEAKSVVLDIFLTDPSVELRHVCKKLLECMTSPVD